MAKIGRPKYSGATVEMVVALKDKGYTYQEVADGLGVSIDLVRRRLREAGKRYPRGGGRPKSEEPYADKCKRLATIRKLQEQIVKCDLEIERCKAMIEVYQEQLRVLKGDSNVHSGNG